MGFDCALFRTRENENVTDFREDSTSERKENIRHFAHLWSERMFIQMWSTASGRGNEETGMKAHFLEYKERIKNENVL